MPDDVTIFILVWNMYHLRIEVSTDNYQSNKGKTDIFSTALKLRGKSFCGLMLRTLFYFLYLIYLINEESNEFIKNTILNLVSGYYGFSLFVHFRYNPV